jgi:hypothetical protein
MNFRKAETKMENSEILRMSNLIKGRGRGIVIATSNETLTIQKNNGAIVEIKSSWKAVKNFVNDYD